MGLFKDPNVFGPYLIPPMAILLEEIGRPRLLGWSTRRNVLLLLLLMGGLVFAYSRAAWLNFAIVATIILGVYALRHGGGRAFRRMLGVLVAAGVAALLVLVATGSSASSRAGRSCRDTTTRASRTRPSRLEVDGQGLRARARPGALELVQSAHSVYVETIFESGVVGIALLIALFAATLLCALAMCFRTATCTAWAARRCSASGRASAEQRRGRHAALASRPGSSPR